MAAIRGGIDGDVFEALLGGEAVNEDGTVRASLDGELYNAPRLRELLLGRGHDLDGADDGAGLLVHLYEEYGEDLVHALDGRFAFTIWDSGREVLLLARDRFGEVPLFYMERRGAIAYASRLQALRSAGEGLDQLDREAVAGFLRDGGLPEGRSLLREVSLLPPGHIAGRRRGEPLAVERYWRRPQPVEATAESVADLAIELGRLLAGSVRSRLGAGAAVLLDDGVCSALLAALAARETSAGIETFTVRWDDDGGGFAAALAREIGADHHLLDLSSADVAERVPALLAGADQPSSEPLGAALAAAAGMAGADAGAVLAGGGGEALFGGSGAGFESARLLAPLGVRSPFLDFELAELAATVPDSIHRGGGGAQLPRLLLADLLPALPQPPAAGGAAPPIGDWLRGPLAAALREHVAGGALVAEGWADQAVGAKVEEHLAGRGDHAAELWRHLALGLWLDRLREGEDGAA